MILEIAAFAGNFSGECPILETGRQVTVHFAILWTIMQEGTAQC